MTTQTETFTVNYPHPPGVLPISERLNLNRRFTGKGVTLAMVDSGFAPHPDIAWRIKRYVDASSRHVLEYNTVNQVDVFSWHGQMTSFIAAGDGRTSDGKYAGVSPGVDLVLIRITSKERTLYERDIQRGMDWLCHRHKQMGIRVVNISVGGDGPTNDPDHPLHRATRELIAEGVVVVIASGNSGRDSLSPPATTPGAIVVGGYDDQNTTRRGEWFAYNSNYGKDVAGNPKPDLIAPAVWLPSPVLADSTMARDAEWLAPLLYTDDPSEQVARIREEGFEEMELQGDPDLLPDYRIHRLVQERIHEHKLIDQYHQHVDGTSVAAPIVAAVAAQLIEANPSLTPQGVKRILKETAVPLANIPLERQGAGIVNPAAAIEMALAAK